MGLGSLWGDLNRTEYPDERHLRPLVEAELELGEEVSYLVHGAIGWVSADPSPRRRGRDRPGGARRRNQGWLLDMATAYDREGDPATEVHETRPAARGRLDWADLVSGCRVPLRARSRRLARHRRGRRRDGVPLARYCVVACTNERRAQQCRSPAAPHLSGEPTEPAPSRTEGFFALASTTDEPAAVRAAAECQVSSRRARSFVVVDQLRMVVS